MNQQQRQKPTTGQVPPRDSGPHGKTLDMLAVKRPEPTFIHQHAPAIKTPVGYVKPRGLTPYVKAEVQ